MARITPFVRTALISASAVLAVAPGVAQAGIVWKADASRSAAAEWASTAAPGSACAVAPADTSTSAVQRVRAPIAADNSTSVNRLAYHFQVSDGSDCYGPRAELGQGNPQNPSLGDRLFYPGQERWISFQAFFPNSYQLHAGNGYSSGLMQLKQIGTYGYPAIGMANGDGYLCVYIDAMHDQQTSDHCGSGYYDLGKPAQNAWVKLTFHVRFSGSNDGFIEVYGDMGDGQGYRPLLPMIHAATSKLDEHGKPLPTQARIGMYRNPLIQGTEDLYVAGFTAATDRASAEANAFGFGGSTPSGASGVASGTLPALGSRAVGAAKPNTRSRPRARVAAKRGARCVRISYRGHHRISRTVKCTHRSSAASRAAAARAAAARAAAARAAATRH